MNTEDIAEPAAAVHVHLTAGGDAQLLPGDIAGHFDNVKRFTPMRSRVATAKFVLAPVIGSQSM